MRSRRRLLAALTLAWILSWFKNDEEMLAFFNASLSPYQQGQAKVLVSPATLSCRQKTGLSDTCTVNAVVVGLLYPPEPPPE